MEQPQGSMRTQMPVEHWAKEVLTLRPWLLSPATPLVALPTLS